MELLQAIIGGVVAGVFGAGAMVATVKVHMVWLRRDVDNAHRRLDDHLKDFHLAK